eukprot:TRINITY_DN4862_c0_g1_i2.p1 TRINITY_DN4862_c0_g1~~TRINITY_DN4862_c0_g1_i2.p1  ORF type:complete len:958 (+),score=169.23 TRINITY_DN4862_c0_g1_i2:147-3020(+)
MEPSHATRLKHKKQRRRKVYEGWNKLKWLNDWIQEKTFSFFDRFGKLIAQFPSITIGIGLIFVAFATACFFALNTENSGVFWIPQRSDYYSKQSYFVNTFGPLYRENLIIIESARENYDVVTPEAMVEYIWIHLQFLGIRINISSNQTNSTFSTNETISWLDVCYRSNATKLCSLETPLDYFLTSRRLASWNATQIAHMDREQLLQDLSAPRARSARGNVLFKPAVFGGARYDENGNVVSVKAFRSVFTTTSDTMTLPNSKLWEAEFLKKAEEIAPKLNYTTLYYLAERSLGDEQGAASHHDADMLAYSFLVMVIYMCFTLGRLNFYQSRVWLALGGTFIIACAICAGLGASALFGLAINTITIILIPYFLFPIGMRFIYVICGDFDSRGIGIKNKLPSHKLRKMIKNVGVTTCVVSIIYIFAFLIGSNSQIPVSRNFCYVMVICMITLYCMMMTVFNACVVLDARRADSKRIEFLCIKTKCGGIGWRRDEPLLKEFCRRWYLPFIQTRIAMTAILVFFVGLLAVCLWGVVSLRLGLEWDQFVSTGYYSDFRTKSQEYFPALGDAGYLVFGDWRGEKQVLYHDPNVQAEIFQMYYKYKKSQWVFGNPGFWLEEFYEWLENQSNHTSQFIDPAVDDPSIPDFAIPPQYFYSWLQEFINATEGNFFVNDIIFNGTTNQIAASRFESYYYRANATEQYVETMVDQENLMAPYQSEVPNFTYSKDYTYEAQYIDFKVSAIVNFIIILVAILVFTTIIFKSLRAAALNVLIAFVTLVITLGFMRFWNITFNSINLLYIFWTTGFALESSAHFTLKFMQNEGTTKERVARAFLEIETHFFNACVGNFLGHLVILIFADFDLFRVFFGRMYMIVIGVCAINGVVLLPVLFTLFGPPSEAARNKREHEPIGLPEIENLFPSKDTEMSDVVPTLSDHDRETPMLPPVGVWTVSQFQCGWSSSQPSY